MGWFSFQRKEGFPTHYKDQHTSASVDVVIAGLILAFVILGISLLSLLPSYKGRRSVVFFFQVVISLIIGGIVVANFGQSWEVASVKITSPYKAGSSGEVKAELGIYIGLRGINITLNNADPHYNHSKGFLEHEDINYNEHFSWEGKQGRFGFGYYAARIAREFREGVVRGLPIPILQVAEYFTFDGEGIRFGRHYRLAGWYSHILLWAAFPCWLISGILFRFVVRYGAIFLMATGWFQFLAIAVWYSTRNFVELQVPFESGHEEVVLKTHFGRDFYMVLINAVVCVSIGFIIYGINALCPDEMCQFFGIDPLTIYDEYHLTKDEIAKEGKKDIRLTRDDGTIERGPEHDDPSDRVIRRISNDQGQLVLRRRTDVASRLFQKSFKGKPGILPKLNPLSRGRPITEESEMTARTPLLTPHYANTPYVDEAEAIPRESLPDYPPPPPEVPPRSNKYKFDNSY